MKISVIYNPTSTLKLGDANLWDCQHDGNISYEEVTIHQAVNDGRDIEWSEQRAFCEDCDKDMTEEVLL